MCLCRGFPSEADIGNIWPGTFFKVGWWAKAKHFMCTVESSQPGNNWGPRPHTFSVNNRLRHITSRFTLTGKAGAFWNKLKSLVGFSGRWTNRYQPVKKGWYKMTNAEFAKEDRWFNTVCRDFCIKPTARQASKFRRKKGIAWKMANLLFDW